MAAPVGKRTLPSPAPSSPWPPPSPPQRRCRCHRASSHRAIHSDTAVPLSSPVSSVFSVAPSRHRRSILGRPVAISAGRRAGGGARARAMCGAGNDGEEASARPTARGYPALNLAAPTDLACFIFDLAAGRCVQPSLKEAILALEACKANNDIDYIHPAHYSIETGIRHLVSSGFSGGASGDSVFVAATKASEEENFF